MSKMWRREFLRTVRNCSRVRVAATLRAQGGAVVGDGLCEVGGDVALVEQLVEHVDGRAEHERALALRVARRVARAGRPAATN